MKSKLQTIADGMRQEILDSGRERTWTSKPLTGGLELILSRDGDAWRLALRREQVPPSNDEADICRRVFGVPDDTPLTLRSKTETHPTTGRSVTWKIIEFNWREIPPAGAAGTPQPA